MLPVLVAAAFTDPDIVRCAVNLIKDARESHLLDSAAGAAGAPLFAEERRTGFGIDLIPLPIRHKLSPTRQWFTNGLALVGCNFPFYLARASLPRPCVVRKSDLLVCGTILPVLI